MANAPKAGETAHRAGKPARERVDLRIAPDGLAIVRQLAESEERTVSDMLRVLVMEALEARKLIPPRSQQGKAGK